MARRHEVLFLWQPVIAYLIIQQMMEEPDSFILIGAHQCGIATDWGGNHWLLQIGLQSTGHGSILYLPWSVGAIIPRDYILLHHHLASLWAIYHVQTPPSCLYVGPLSYHCRYFFIYHFLCSCDGQQTLPWCYHLLTLNHVAWLYCRMFGQENF